MSMYFYIVLTIYQSIQIEIHTIHIALGLRHHLPVI